MLIAFEGLDQSGKETQSKRFRDRLRAVGDKARVVSFPDYGTSIGEEIARPNTRSITNLDCIGAFIGKGGQPCGPGEGSAQRLSQRAFLPMRTIEYLHHHLKTLLVDRHLPPHVGSIGQDVEIIAFHQLVVVGVRPSSGVQVNE